MIKHSSKRQLTSVCTPVENTINRRSWHHVWEFRERSDCR
jgi:hypothetical protein